MVSKPLTAIIMYPMEFTDTWLWENNLMYISVSLHVVYTPLCPVFNNVMLWEWISDVLIIPGCQGNTIDSRRVLRIIIYMSVYMHLSAYGHPASGPWLPPVVHIQYINFFFRHRIQQLTILKSEIRWGLKFTFVNSVVRFMLNIQKNKNK